MPVHLFGNVAPVPELRELGVPVLEDAAQAAGASLGGTMAGALGDAATFSFFPSKNLPCLGDGGAISTNDAEVAERARVLRFHGSKDKRHHTDVGYNSRLDAIQAAVLRMLLPELDGWNEARRERRRALRARRARRAPAAARGRPRAPSTSTTSTWSCPMTPTSWCARSRRTASARAATTAHRSTASRRWALRRGALPVTDELAATLLALPMGTELEPAQVDAVVAACAGRVRS